MARTLPAGISSKISTNYAARILWLVEWLLPGNSKYYSSGESVSYGGNTFEANRVVSISSLTSQFIDRDKREFSKVTIKLDNLANDGSSSFPITALDAGQVLEDAPIKIHLYDLDAAAAVDSIWFGYSMRPRFNPADKTVDLQATFLWDSSEVAVPSKTPVQLGFGTLDANRNKESENKADIAIPLVFGVTNIRTRPVIYAARVEQGYLHCNFIVSGAQSGFPFGANDIVNARLFDNTNATEVEFLTGSSGQTAPANLTRFPDGQAHALVAYAYAAFPVTDDQKSELDNLKDEDIKVNLLNGRPLLDTGLPSENPVLILKDILRDPTFGLGLASGDFDATTLTAASSYAASRYQVRVELREQIPLVDLIQQLLGDCHCFITFNSNKLQIRHKSGAEAAVATFATSDSGSSGRVIHEDEVEAWEKDFSEVTNQIKTDYRKKNRHKRTVILYDTTAQARAGGNIKKIVSEDFESFIHDEDKVKISTAIALREALNANLYIRFSVPIFEGLDVAPGDVIEVRSPDIFNNGSNNLFRIYSQTFETGDEPLVTMECQVYKPAVYNDDATGLGVDLLRGSTDTSRQGRPPDVTPSSLQVVDVVTNDTEGKLATIRAQWAYPAVDLASEQTNENVFREYPIAAVQLWWHYNDESVHEARLAKEIKYPTAQGDFDIDFKKSKSIVVYFVAIGHNRSRSPLGYIPDQTKETWLTANLSATAPTASVQATGAFTVNDFCYIENELVKLSSKTSNSLTFISSGGNRSAQLNTTAIAHPSGTEVTVAKQSYPSLTLALTAPRFTYPVVTSPVARKRNDGVRFKWADVSAENNEEYYLYWSTDADAGSNAAKLGSATPAWYTTDPNSPPVSVKFDKVKALAFKVLQEDIGAAGTTVFARIAARNGKNNYSSALSALVSNAHFGDTAAPGAVQNLALVWSTKKGWKATWQRPATNIESLLGYYVVYFDNAGTNFMNPNTGALNSPNSEAGARFFVKDTHHATLLNYTQLAAQFQAGVKVKITPVNMFSGVESEGTSTTSSLVAPVKNDPQIEDSAAASAVQSLALVWSNRKGWKATWKRPASNILSLLGYKVVYFDNAGTNFMNPHTGALNSPNTEVGATIFVPDTHHTTHLKFSEVAAQFSSGVKVKVTPVNIVAGVETDGTSTTSSLVAPVSDDPLASDSAAPGSLPTPILKFKRGKLLAKINMSGVTNVLTLKDRVELCVHNGSNSLNLDDPTSETIVSGLVFYQVGVAHKTLPFDKDQLIRIFGVSANLKARFKLTNDVNSTTSADSADLALSSLVDVTTLYNPQQMLFNGHFTYADPGDSNIAKIWQDYDPRNGAFSQLTQTGRMRWDKAEHRAKWRDTNTVDNQRFLVQNMGKKFFKSEWFSFTWNIYSNGTPTLDEFAIFLATQKTLTNTISVTAGTNTVSGSGFTTDGVKVGTIIGNGTEWRTVTLVNSSTLLTVDRNWGTTLSGQTGRALIPQSDKISQINLALSTADKFQRGSVQTHSDLDTSLPIYFVALLRDIVDTVTFPFLDTVMMVSGRSPVSYQRRNADSYETNGAGTSEDFDAAPTGGSGGGGGQEQGGGGGAGQLL